jgi:hypothetical protein
MAEAFKSEESNMRTWHEARDARDARIKAGRVLAKGKIVETRDALGAETFETALALLQTLDHVVYLSGEVSAGEMSRTAEAVAPKSPGVTRVVNNIAVRH